VSYVQKDLCGRVSVIFLFFPDVIDCVQTRGIVVFPNVIFAKKIIYSD